MSCPKNGAGYPSRSSRGSGWQHLGTRGPPHSAPSESRDPAERLACRGRAGAHRTSATVAADDDRGGYMVRFRARQVGYGCSRDFILAKSHSVSDASGTKAIPGTLQDGGASFQTTHWTVVLRAREPDSADSASQALSGFCEAYWPPLYSFVRHRGYASADAQDLVQGFFAHLLEQNTLTRADQEKGRLRTFLLASLQK